MEKPIPSLYYQFTFTISQTGGTSSCGALAGTGNSSMGQPGGTDLTTYQTMSYSLLPDRKKGNLLLPHRLLFPISNKGSFMCIIPQTGKRIPHGALATTRNSSMGPP